MDQHRSESYTGYGNESAPKAQVRGDGVLRAVVVVRGPVEQAKANADAQQY
jgi:hypothetical protein